MEESQQRIAPPRLSLNKNDLNDIDLPKPTWFDKEFSQFLLLKYRPRYLVLTTTHLYYFRHAPTDAQLSHVSPTTTNNDQKTIPLSNIDLTALTENGIKEPEFLYIQLPEKLYRFRAHDVSDAIKWRMAILSVIRVTTIQTASSTNLLKHSNFPTVSAPAGNSNYPNLTSSTNNNANAEKYDLSPTLLNQLKSKDLMVFEFERLIFTSADKAKYVANLFFDSLSVLPSKDRNNRAKEMGKALIAWLEVEASEALDRYLHIETIVRDNDNIGDSEKNVSDKSNEYGGLDGTSLYQYHSKLDVFVLWLRTALSREYLASCKFDESNTMDHNDDASSESSTMTHSTIKSRMKAARKGSIIMPFRADTAECLFISSIIHSSALKYSLLHHLLFSVLRPVAASPESYTYPKPLPPMPPSAHATNTASISQHGENRTSGTFAPVNSDRSNPRGSIRRQSTRFFGMVRNLFGGHGNQNNQNGNNPRLSNIDENTPKERPGSADMAKALSAFHTYYHFLPTPPEAGNHTSNSTTNTTNGGSSINNANNNNPDYLRQQQLLSLEELASLSPFELKRIETRKKLLDCALLLVNRLDEICPYFPVAIRKIITTIRDLIIISNDQSFHVNNNTLQSQYPSINNNNSSAANISVNHGHNSSSNVIAHHHPSHSSLHHSGGHQLHSNASSAATIAHSDLNHGQHHHVNHPDYADSQEKATMEEDHRLEMVNNRRRFEYGTYFTSCSALLFLRLICRAIISPDDYGVMTNVIPSTMNMDYTSSKKDHGDFSSMSNSEKLNRESEEENNGNNNSGKESEAGVDPLSKKTNQGDEEDDKDLHHHYPYRGLPAMYFIAATIAQAEKIKANSANNISPSATGPAGKGIPPAATTNSSIPVNNPNIKKDGIAGSPFPSPTNNQVPYYAREISDFSRQISSEIEYKDAVKLLDFYQSKKFTLTMRESIHIEREQLSLLQASLKSSTTSFSDPNTPSNNNNNSNNYNNSSSINNNNPTANLNDMIYEFDYSKPTTRWALAEVAKSVQHIANISCLPKEEMQNFARESLIRTNIGIGAQDKDSYDTYVLTGYEMNTINTQIFIATRIKEVYEKLGNLPSGNW